MVLDKLLHSSVFLITDLAVRYPNNSLERGKTKKDKL